MSRHGHEIFHSVTAMNIQYLAGGAQPMSGIRIACMFDAVSFSPMVVIAAFALFGKVQAQSETLGDCVKILIFAS